jgi:hypothetical protein
MHIVSPKTQMLPKSATEEHVTLKIEQKFLNTFQGHVKATRSCDDLEHQKDVMTNKTM